MIRPTLTALFLLWASLAAAQDLKPIPPWSPSADEFAARIAAIETQVKASNPDKDWRIDQRLRLVSARSGGKRAWIDKESWVDGKVRFAVVKVTGVQDGVKALASGEKQVMAKLKADKEDSRRVLDWYIDDDGNTFVLAGMWEPVAEK